MKTNTLTKLNKKTAKIMKTKMISINEGFNPFWAKLFDEWLEKIAPQYIESKSFSITPDFQHEKTDPTEFQNNLWFCFLNLVDRKIDNAFILLQNRLPNLAEHIILSCYEGKLVSKKKFAKLFIATYTNGPKYQNLFSSEIKTSKILEIIKYCGMNNIMNKVDRSYYKWLPEIIPIYRGTAGRRINESKNGISWSLCRNKAKEFALFNKKYFDSNYGIIIDAMIKKSDVLLYVHESARFEYEAIINPENILSIRHEKI